MLAEDLRALTAVPGYFRERLAPGGRPLGLGDPAWLGSQSFPASILARCE